MGTSRMVQALVLLLSFALVAPVQAASAQQTSSASSTKASIRENSNPPSSGKRKSKPKSHSKGKLSKKAKYKLRLKKVRLAKRAKLQRAKKRLAAKRKAKAKRAAQRKAKMARESAKKSAPVVPQAPHLASTAPIVAPNQPDSTGTSEKRNVLVDKSMWLWNWDSNEEVIEFAIENNVRDVFTYAHPGFSSNDDLLVRLADLSRRGNDQGVRMWAMGGDPSWVTDNLTATNWVDEVVGSGLFDGIHFEIEPHSQEGYWENTDERNRQFLELLDKAQVHAQHHVLELSLPWWFHTIEVQGSTLDVEAIKRVDQLTIATFNNAVAGIEMNAEHPVAVARQFSKPYRLASETNRVETNWITFVGLSNQQMLQTQEAVGTRFTDDPLYQGFAVHEFNGWKALIR